VPELYDTDSLPLTEPHPAPIFDTGPHPDPLMPLVAEQEPEPEARPEPNGADRSLQTGDLPIQTGELPVIPAAEPVIIAEPPVSEPIPTPSPSVVVPGTYQSVKWWRFVLVVAGVWLLAAAAGLGLYYWWYQAVDKTPTVFVVLMYLVVCSVASLLIAMVQNRPLVAVLAIALMSSPLAATAAAAALYGAYVFRWIER
jgi:hypothetical protein